MHKIEPTEGRYMQRLVERCGELAGMLIQFRNAERGTAKEGTLGAVRTMAKDTPPTWDAIAAALCERTWLPEFSARLPEEEE
jgi:hypothetical protein